MKAKKILTLTSACAMAALVLAPSVLAAETGTSQVPVKYDFSNKVEPTGAKYAMNIPAGITFDASNPSKYITIDVEMVAPQGETTFSGKALVTVQSTKGSVVSLDEAGTDDPVGYVLKYGAGTMSGKEALTVATFAKDASGTADLTKVSGTAQLNGVATKTGTHSDTLTYTITDQTSAG